MRAGLPVTTSGLTINRFCSSGLQAIALAAQRIIAGENDVLVAGGLESISCVQPHLNPHMAFDPELTSHEAEIYWSMLQTAEQVAKRYHISRDARTSTAPPASKALRPRPPACSMPRSPHEDRHGRGRQGARPDHQGGDREQGRRHSRRHDQGRHQRSAQRCPAG
jgi:hypothetical protein